MARVDAAVEKADGAVEFDERRAKLERLRAEGIDPYPPVSLWNERERIEDVLAAHDPAELEPGEHPELPHHIAGRLVARRGHGKTAFLDVRDLSGTIQVVARADAIGQQEYDRMLSLDIGDIVGVKGVVYITQRGQLALAVKECTLLTKALRPPRTATTASATRAPATATGSSTCSPTRTRELFITRTKIVVRDPRVAERTQLHGSRNARPAVARRGRRSRPFTTHHNALEPRPVPEDLGGAVPQPLHRRRHGERLRHGQGVPQRGHLSEAQPRVHDHRVHAWPMPITTTWPP